MKIGNDVKFTQLDTARMQQDDNTIKIEKTKEIKNPYASTGDVYKKLKDRSELPSVSEKALIDTIEKANKAIDGASTKFRFAIHDKTHEIMIKIIDKDSQKVIREIPPEKTLDMIAKMWDMAGIFVDEKK